MPKSQLPPPCWLSCLHLLYHHLDNRQHHLHGHLIVIISIAINITTMMMNIITTITFIIALTLLVIWVLFQPSQSPEASI